MLSKLFTGLMLIRHNRINCMFFNKIKNSIIGSLADYYIFAISLQLFLLSLVAWSGSNECTGPTVDANAIQYKERNDIMGRCNVTELIVNCNLHSGYVWRAGWWRYKGIRLQCRKVDCTWSKCYVDYSQRGNTVDYVMMLSLIWCVLVLIVSVYSYV